MTAPMQALVDKLAAQQAARAAAVEKTTGTRPWSAPEPEGICLIVTHYRPTDGRPPWTSEPCKLLAGHQGRCIPDLTGWSAKHDGEEADVRAARRAWRRMEREDAWRTKMPERFRYACLEDVTQPKVVLDHLREWIVSPTRESLILLGTVGAGKTFAACATGREAFLRGESVAFVSAARMFYGLRPDGGARMEQFTDPDVLILDDLGAEKRSDWTDETLDVLVDTRWCDRKSTIVTSNLSRDQLQQHVGARAYDRLADDAVALTLTRRSGRRRRAA